MPTSQLQTAQHFEWDTPWSFGFLALCCLLAAGWSLWNLWREGVVAQSRWGLVFIILRTVIAGVLLWMILGPTTVLVQTETYPQTVAVFVDNSTSMQLRDQADPAADRRWDLAAGDEKHPLILCDQAALLSEAMRQELSRLTTLIDRQAIAEECRSSSAKWERWAKECATLCEMLAATSSLTAQQRTELRTLTDALKNELLPLTSARDWWAGPDAGDRENCLRRLDELGRQFSVGCRILADDLAHASDAEGPAPVNSQGLAKSRLEKIVPALQRGLGAWRRQGAESFRLLASEFSDSVSPLPLENWESSLAAPPATAAIVRSTDLNAVLRQIRDESVKQQLTAAVLLTDGRQTAASDDDPRQLAAQLHIPLYVVPVGWGEMRRDVILHHLHAPSAVIHKDKILIEGIATAYRCAGEAGEVQLLEGNKVLDRQPLAFEHNQQDQAFRFEVSTEKVGRREFTIRIPEVRDEFSSDNNFAAVGVDVVDDMLRVLVADGVARWELQYLVNLLKRQKQLEFDQLRFWPRQAGTGAREPTHQFPRTVEEWSDYRVVILGDVGPRQLPRSSQESLREYVTQRGGCLIVIAGQNHMPQAFAGEPLEDLLPVQQVSGFKPADKGYRVEMTAEGKSLDAMRLDEDVPSTEGIWREMSVSLPIQFLSSYHRPKPASETLLSAVPVNAGRGADEPQSYLCWHRVGAGRVAYLSSPSTYQLRMRNGDKFHYRFWGQLMRWMASNAVATGSKTVKLQADRSHYQSGDAAQLRLDLSDASGRPVTNAQPTVEAVQGGQVQVAVALSPDPKVPGRYLGKYAAEAAGRYSLRARGAEVDRLLATENVKNGVQVEIEFAPDLDRERLDPRSDRPLLEYLAEQTGGQVLEPTALATLSEILPLEPRKVESSQRTPLWDRWWCLWTILGCLTLEWLLRKQIGLA